MTYLSVLVMRHIFRTFLDIRVFEHCIDGQKTGEVNILNELLSYPMQEWCTGKLPTYVFKTDRHGVGRYIMFSI